MGRERTQDHHADDTALLHPLAFDGCTVPLPAQLNNPFYYEPDAWSRKAMDEVVDYLYGRSTRFLATGLSDAFQQEIDNGKMFGVLVVAPADATGSSQLSYLAAYSGQIGGRSDWPGFVPAVFDYLQADGYFKVHEAEISRLNATINQLAEEADNTTQSSPTNFFPDDPKPVGDKQRHEDETDEAFIRRRQFENARLHQWKLRQRERENSIAAERRQKSDNLTALRALRRQKSDDLQRWLFHHFVMCNGRGEQKDLIEITRAALMADGTSTATAGAGGAGAEGVLPPAGSGECCEPKLLQYALSHGLRPVSMAMFWWGKSPKNEVRHHLHCYPACHSKCRPILRWMLQGIKVAPNPLEDKERDAALVARLKTLYDDDAICVVSKPAGLLAVPGKNGRESVLSVMRHRFPDSDSPLIVHRLDMDTSGLMVIAKTPEAYHGLQTQFARHTIIKRYVAIVQPQPATNTSFPGRPTLTAGSEGTISLPLRPDLDDRPRQVVDFAHGRPAMTRYHCVAQMAPAKTATKAMAPDKAPLEYRLWLYPLTGRTHQLRVHCAHEQGLNAPIKGDPLYGEKADRLYLHAEQLTFCHPITGQRMTFTDKAPF